MNFRQKIAVGVLDVLVITELCVSMFLASQDPVSFTGMFCRSFFSMLIPTLVTARIVIKRLPAARWELAE